MESLKNLLLTLGIPGVVFVAALDSAGMPMPGGPDAVVMLVSWQRPAWMPIVALAASMGSLIGCSILYLVGRKGGELGLQRFDAERRELVKKKLQANDWLAVFVSVIGPPPFPTKLFILSAGVIEMRWPRFVSSVLSGRILRYLVEGYLGAMYGGEAAGILKAHYPSILAALLVVPALFIVVKRILSGRRAGNA